MEIKSIDHVEFFVADVEKAASHLCGALGFRVAAWPAPGAGPQEVDSLLLRQGGIQVAVTSATDGAHPAARYVRRHGDGVGVIAFATPDARAAFAAATRRGAAGLQPPAEYASASARVVVAEVAGFGDVTHRFVERHGADEFHPGRIAMTEAAAADDGTDLLRLLDHVAVCVPAGQLAATERMYRDVFGFERTFGEYIEVGDQAMDSSVVQDPSGRVTFTLLEPDAARKPGQIDTFLARHGGPGVQHLAFLTEDIIAAVGQLRGRGVHFLDTPDAYYEELGRRLGRVGLGVEALRDTRVLVDRDHWGLLFQIFTESVHERGTYFTEIVDRRGARSFGTGNIRALYEAVERNLRA